MKNVFIVIVQILLFTNVFSNNWKSIASPTSVNEIVEHNDQLYIASSGGLIITNMQGEVRERILKSDGIPSNQIEDVVVLANGNIWIGTYDNGIAFFDGSDWLSWPLPDQLFFNATLLYTIEVDAEGNVWAGTSNGVLKLTNNNWQVKSTWPCWDIVKDNNGTIWGAGSYPFTVIEDSVVNQEDCPIFAYGDASVFARSNGNLLYGNDAGELAEFDNGSWETWSIEDSLFSFNYAITDIQESGSKLYLATGFDAVYTFENAEFTIISEDLSSQFNVKKLWVSDTDELVVGAKNKLLMGTSNNLSAKNLSWLGINDNDIREIYHYGETVIVHSDDDYIAINEESLAFEVLGAPTGYNNFINWHAYHNPASGNLAFYNGLTGELWENNTLGQLYDPNTTTIAHHVRDVLKDQSGNTWISTNMGLYLFPPNGSHEHFTSANTDFTNDNFWEIGEDNNGIIWASSSSELGRWDGGAWISVWNEMDSNYVFAGGASSYYFDQNNNAYYASWNNGLSVYDGNQWENYNIVNTNIADNQVTDIYEFEGKIYLTTEEGVSVLDQGNFTVLNKGNSGLHENKCNTLVSDNMGNLWIAGKNGLSIYNKNGVVSSISKEEKEFETSVYPNPTSGAITLESEQEMESVQLFNMQGALVYTSKLSLAKHSLINISKLSKGLYVARIHHQAGISTQRIVVQ